MNKSFLLRMAVTFVTAFICLTSFAGEDFVLYDISEIAVDLSKWFDFKESGTYEVRRSYYMSFIDAKNCLTIWEDFACGEFMVKIKK